MKKIFEKIVSISLFVISLLFVVIMLLFMFKPEYADSLDDKLVKILIIVFSSIFAVLSILNIIAAFSNRDKVSAVLLYKSKSTSTKATVSVVKKWVRDSVKQAGNAKVSKVMIFVGDNNEISLKATLKVKSDVSVVNVVTRSRIAVKTTMEDVLGLEFDSIDFVLAGVNRKYILDKNEVYKATDKEIERLTKEKEREALRLKDKEADMEPEKQEVAPEDNDVAPEDVVPETENIQPEIKQDGE